MAIVAPSAPTRSACGSSRSHSPARSAIAVLDSLVRTTLASRKLVSTNSPSVRPISSLRLGMIAVCGIGSPSGRRNRAVTANQSASAPTIPPSAAARTYASHGCRSWNMNAMTNAMAMKTRAPSATAFIRRSARSRTWSEGDSIAIGVRGMTSSFHAESTLET